MIRIGNDIVDLNLAKTQSNWQRKGFLEKQFTKEEQKEILSAKYPFLKVWLFWSMKEAAYKCYTQVYKERFFAPLKISCEIVNDSFGSATINQHIYSIKYKITDNYIHTIAQNNKSKKMVKELFRFDNSKKISQKIYQKLLDHFNNDVQLQKNGYGVPFLHQNNNILPVSISISHHGKYGAFVISRSDTEQIFNQNP